MRKLYVPTTLGVHKVNYIIVGTIKLVFQNSEKHIIFLLFSDKIKKVLCTYYQRYFLQHDNVALLNFTWPTVRRPQQFTNDKNVLR